MRRLPSLNGLRAFEAAARLGSFTAAAVELGVTQTAVSRLVRLLEARFGFALFERRPNRLALTTRGSLYQAGLSQAFDAIAGLTEQVAASQQGPVLTVGAGPTFAMRWLIPRLADFQKRHPDIDVRMTTGGLAIPFRDDWTCGISQGDGDWPGFVAEPLFAPDMFPVCTPAIGRRLQQPADLQGVDLLQVAHAPDDWPQWLAAAGVQGMTPRGPRFDYYTQALQAALDGVGVAIGLYPYVADDLAAGRLVAPFRLTVPKGRAWYLIYRPARAADPTLQAFRSWLNDNALGQADAARLPAE